jgi:hypothetical protein
VNPIFIFLKYLFYVFCVLTCVFSEAEACRDATNAAARELIAADLNAFLTRNPNGTFIGWIASLHPENVHLDSRM